MAAADTLAVSMKPPYFTCVSTGPGNLFGSEFFSRMLSAIPSLLSDDNFENLATKVEPEQIRERMRSMYQELITPEGWMKKELFRNDPLNLSGLLFEQLRFANLLSGMRIENQHFVSKDRKNVLIIAETPINGTDSRGSTELMAQLAGLIKASVPRPMEAFVMAAHRYTATNANAVKQDVFVVMCSSFLGIVIIIALFLFSWAGLFILLVPVLSLSVAGSEHSHRLWRPDYRGLFCRPALFAASGPAPGILILDRGDMRSASHLLDNLSALYRGFAQKRRISETDMENPFTKIRNCYHNFLVMPHVGVYLESDRDYF
jgi:hypothetical protein